MGVGVGVHTMPLVLLFSNISGGMETEHWAIIGLFAVVRSVRNVIVKKNFSPFFIRLIATGL